MYAAITDSSFTTQCRFLPALKQKAFENIMGKRENDGNQHFLLFPQCLNFLSILIQKYNVFYDLCYILFLIFKSFQFGPV